MYTEKGIQPLTYVHIIYGSLGSNSETVQKRSP